MMAAVSFLGLDASSERAIPDESTALKMSRIMRQNEQNVNGGGIEQSHGKNWFRGRMIGRGAAGSVYLADPIIFSGFPSQMAVKSAQMPHSFSIQREKKILSVLDGSPSLVGCYGDEITETESGEKIYNLLMEYCSGGSLDDHISQSTNGLPESEVASFARDIARGLDYMHTNGYVHCDIKPENILLVPEKPSLSEKVKYAAKIVDFGLSLNMFESYDECPSIRGTLGYLAPEMLRDREIDWPIDIWSFGCTVLEMLTGEPAWGSELMEKNEQKAMEHIGYSYESPKIPDYVSEKAKDFLNKCLDPVCAYDRWPASKLLKHPFFLRPPPAGIAAADTEKFHCLSMYWI